MIRSTPAASAIDTQIAHGSQLADERGAGQRQRLQLAARGAHRVGLGVGARVVVRERRC